MNNLQNAIHVCRWRQVKIGCKVNDTFHHRFGAEKHQKQHHIGDTGGKEQQSLAGLTVVELSESRHDGQCCRAARIPRSVASYGHRFSPFYVSVFQFFKGLHFRESGIF